MSETNGLLLSNKYAFYSQCVTYQMQDLIYQNFIQCCHIRRCLTRSVEDLISSLCILHLRNRFLCVSHRQRFNSPLESNLLSFNLIFTSKKKNVARSLGGRKSRNGNNRFCKKSLHGTTSDFISPAFGSIIVTIIYHIIIILLLFLPELPLVFN